MLLHILKVLEDPTEKKKFSIACIKYYLGCGETHGPLAFLMSQIYILVKKINVKRNNIVYEYNV